MKYGKRFLKVCFLELIFTLLGFRTSKGGNGILVVSLCCPSVSRPCLSGTTEGIKLKLTSNKMVA